MRNKASSHHQRSMDDNFEGANQVFRPISLIHAGRRLAVRLLAVLTLLGLGATALPLTQASAAALPANAAAAWNYFVGDTKLTPSQAAGLLGNLWLESGLNPTATQGGRCGPCGYGIAQWSINGTRYQALQKLATAEHAQLSDLGVQLDFVWQELNSTYRGAGTALAGCATGNSAKDIECATTTVMLQYEKPLDQSTACPSKHPYCTRLAYANAVYSALNGTKATPPPAPVPSVVCVLPTWSGGGQFVVRANGVVSVSGDAVPRGDLSGVKLNAPVRGGALTPSGQGYWLVAADGGVFAFGDAQFFGSAGSIKLNAPIVGMAATPTGNGYWLVAADGGVFAYGDAQFYGSTGSIKLNAPIVAMATTPTGNGYWLVAADGGVFAYGDAQFYGSTGGIKLNAPIVAVAATPTGQGYLLAASDGGIFAFGDATFRGNFVGTGRTAAAIATTADGGYALLDTSGAVTTYSPPDRVAIVANGHAYVKEGGLGAGWTDIASNVKSVAVSKTRVAVITTTGDLYAADGPLTTPLTKIGQSVTAVSLTPSRVAALGTGSHVYVETGALSAATWVDVAASTTSTTLSGHRIAVVSNGHLYVKEGTLSAPWIDEYAPATAGTISGNRIGAIDTNGNVWVKEGSLNSGWTNPGGNARSLSLTSNRMAVQSNDGTYYATDAPITAPAWLPEYAPSNAGTVTADRVTILTNGNLYAKEGGLSTGWTQLWSTATGTATTFATDNT